MDSRAQIQLIQTPSCGVLDVSLWWEKRWLLTNVFEFSPSDSLSLTDVVLYHLANSGNTCFFMEITLLPLPSPPWYT